MQLQRLLGSQCTLEVVVMLKQHRDVVIGIPLIMILLHAIFPLVWQENRRFCTVYIHQVGARGICGIFADVLSCH